MNEKNERSPMKIEADPKPPGFSRLAKTAREIQGLGYDEQTAAHYAILIGDKPTIQADGTVLIIEGGRQIAALRLPSVTNAKSN